MSFAAAEPRHGCTGPAGQLYRILHSFPSSARAPLSHPFPAAGTALPAPISLPLPYTMLTPPGTPAQNNQHRPQRIKTNITGVGFSGSNGHSPWCRARWQPCRSPFERPPRTYRSARGNR
ncbi:hypothetical protein NDU88_005937 [Pleurodeles waltl]|uniref:Uncharacterized protein n=1 Tax=Pleurodeles waltl TaxID=8319 RepID=A0AAV7TWU3_PLEWA|nr:hypothetical protein NDU88_005937 [Pleurodeles waltl]